MIRDEIGSILGVYIPKGGLRQIVNELDPEGHITQRTLLDLLIILFNHVEKLEDAREDSKTVQSS